MSTHDADMIAVLSRLADLLDRLLPEPAPARAKKKKPAAVGSMRDRVSVIRRNHFDPSEPEWDGRDGPPPAGGTDIEEWRRRPDPDAAAMKRTKRLPAGRPFV